MLNENFEHGVLEMAREIVNSEFKMKNSLDAKDG